MPNRNERFRNVSRNDFRNSGQQNRQNQRGNYHGSNRSRGSRTVYFENSNNVRRTGGTGRSQQKPFNKRGIFDKIDAESQWFKITIPHGDKSTKDFLLTSLHSMCEKPFVPYNFQVDGQTVVFYVQGQDTSEALKCCSRRITNNNGFKYTIISSRSPVPHTQLDAATISHLKETMSRRYDLHRKLLNMSKLRNDEYLKEHGLFIPLSRPNMLIAVIRIIKENIPDLVYLNLSDNRIANLEAFESMVETCKLLKSLDLSFNQIRHTNELEHLKGLDLEEIVLQKNPFSDQIRDRASYISTIRSIFPKVVKLDNDELSAPIVFDVGDSATLPPTLGSFIQPELNQFIVGFIQQYFTLYDSDDRQKLSEAYHEQAMFSFAISSSNKSQGSSAFFPSHMFQESRNLMKVKDSTARSRMLQHGKANIVSTLAGFPKTKHEMDSFLVDVHPFTPQLISVVINGVYRETTKKYGVQTRSFCRTFLIIPNLIINDLLFLSNATVEQIQKYGKTTETAPSTSNRMEDQVIIAPSVAVGSSGDAANSVYMNKAHLVKRFAEATRMNTSFSMQCLEEHAYDFDAAMQVFQTLNSQGLIPAEAFQT